MRAHPSLVAVADTFAASMAIAVLIVAAVWIGLRRLFSFQSNQKG